MKSKFYLFSSIFQLIVGLAAIASFVILAINKEVIEKWIITLLLAIAFCIMGVIGIIDCIKNRAK